MVFHRFFIVFPHFAKAKTVRQLPGNLARIPPGFSDNAQVPRKQLVLLFQRLLQVYGFLIMTSRADSATGSFEAPKTAPTR